MAKLLAAMAELNITDDAENSRLSFLSFRDETSPLKRALSISMLLMISVITAMLISLGLVDEKNDQTIKAANVTPMPQSAYVISKSLIGVIALLFTSVCSLLILGIVDINWATDHADDRRQRADFDHRRVCDRAGFDGLISRRPAA